jgi:ribA/ribD-fused uncharacterized protein
MYLQIKTIMERCSFFIPNKALFGSYPDQSTVDELERLGVRYFVDLTFSSERNVVPYKTRYKYVNYPIYDRRIPKNWRTFAQLVLEICHIIRKLENNQKLYLHCKGGHGRSGIVVACVLCYYYSVRPSQALERTAMCHSNRPEMREKWRRIGSPQNKKQKDFVMRFYRSLKFGKEYQTAYTIGMDNNSQYSVETELGTFSTAQGAFQAYKDPENKEFIEKLKGCKNKNEIIEVCKTCKTPNDWESKKSEYLYHVLVKKFSQHRFIKENLLNTGLRPIVKISSDSYWGNGLNGTGKNIHGKILAKVRNNFLLKESSIGLID